jgi:hypothetical protein
MACRGPRGKVDDATPADAAPAASAQPEAAAPMAEAPRIESRWDPKTGKGDVVHTLAGGDLLRTCFQCDYPGYAGGLAIGAFNSSGLGFYPRNPIRGHSKINLFCAQDESIFDRDERAEYSYGWSENFGKGDDGKRLEYVRGRTLDAGPDRVVLESENQGGCYMVRKVASSRANARFWVIATRITNRCQHPVHFDLFTGDDPWIGTYRSAEGDVGWTPDAIVRTETALGVGLFSAGGLYDLGNGVLGQTEGSFSGQADFFAIDPAVDLPDIAAFANSFAHSDRDVRRGRPLDQKTMIALNLGWKNRTLAPGEGFTVAFAAGMAETDEPDGGAAPVPRLPPLTDDDWSVWRQYLEHGARPDASSAVHFAAERVEITVGADEIAVVGTYHLLNASGGATRALIEYPILSGPDRPAPNEITVNGQTFSVDPSAGGNAARFPVSFPARGLVGFEVRYVQRHTERRAGYMVTSALSWPGPIGRAVFVVRYPAALGKVQLSYRPDSTRRVGDSVEHVIVRQPFRPDRELTISW